jgi:hypothetical protein
MNKKRFITSKTGEVMTVFDGVKTIAKARKIPSGGWLLKLYDGCWIHPAARAPSKVTRAVDASLMVLPLKRSATAEMMLLFSMIR